jgi:hypothetical protein
MHRREFKKIKKKIGKKWEEAQPLHPNYPRPGPSRRSWPSGRAPASPLACSLASPAPPHSARPSFPDPPLQPSAPHPHSPARPRQLHPSRDPTPSPPRSAHVRGSAPMRAHARRSRGRVQPPSSLVSGAPPTIHLSQPPPPTTPSPAPTSLGSRKNCSPSSPLACLAIAPAAVRVGAADAVKLRRLTREPCRPPGARPRFLCTQQRGAGARMHDPGAISWRSVRLERGVVPDRAANVARPAWPARLAVWPALGVRPVGPSSRSRAAAAQRALALSVRHAWLSFPIRRPVRARAMLAVFTLHCPWHRRSLRVGTPTTLA